MFKRIFISGLTVIIPLVITIYVIIALFNFADGFLGASVNTFFQETLNYTIPGIGIVIAILMILLVGVLVEISRMRLFKWLSNWIEQLFFNIPLVNKIYMPVRQIVNFLFFPKRKSFKNTVLVEYPRKGIYVIGLLTNENTLDFPQKGTKKFYSVFIPSSPSPITGFTIIVEESDLVFLDIGVDEAIKLVVSGGLLNP
tara:strand:+ start:1265 stop:1858 length:594 start_codon:yes stop_codon:yes gene_type:complete